MGQTFYYILQIDPASKLGGYCKIKKGKPIKFEEILHETADICSYIESGSIGFFETAADIHSFKETSKLTGIYRNEKTNELIVKTDVEFSSKSLQSSSVFF